MRRRPSIPLSLRPPPFFHLFHSIIFSRLLHCILSFSLLMTDSGDPPLSFFLFSCRMKKERSRKRRNVLSAFLFLCFHSPGKKRYLPPAVAGFGIRQILSFFIFLFLQFAKKNGKCDPQGSDGNRKEAEDAEEWKKGKRGKNVRRTTKKKERRHSFLLSLSYP